MTTIAPNLQDLFRPEELRLTGDGRIVPSASGLAEYFRAAASALFDEVPAAAGGSPAPLSGRVVRIDVIDRLTPLYSFGTTAGDALFGDSDPALDVSAPQVRAVFDALVDVGDFIDVGHGRFYPSRTRLVALAPGAWVLVSGAPADILGLKHELWRRCSFSRVVAQLPELPYVAQSLSNWLGLPASDYVRFAFVQLALPLEPRRQSTTGWQVARIESARTSWVDPETLTDFTQPVVARCRPDEQQPWQRYIARLHRSADGVECVAAREVTYADFSRILHGQKVARGFTPRLRLVEADKGCRIYCDPYFLSEVQRLLLALSFDFSESEGTTEYYIAAALRPVLRQALAGLGVNMTEGRRDE